MAYTSFAELKALWTAIKTALENIRDTSGIKKITDPVDISDRVGRALGKISADSGAIASLGALADAAVTNPAIAASVIALLKGILKQLQGDGSGSLPTRTPGINDLVTGAITIGATQTELKAGVSRMTDRIMMIIYPPNAGVIYWGPNGVTSESGAPLTADDPPVIFDFNPDVDFPLYAVNDGTDRQIRVVESK